MQRSALCRSRRELSNAYFLAKFRFDTAENEQCKICRILAVERPVHDEARPARLRRHDGGLSRANPHKHVIHRNTSEFHANYALSNILHDVYNSEFHEKTQTQTVRWKQQEMTAIVSLPSCNNIGLTYVGTNRFRYFPSKSSRNITGSLSKQILGTYCSCSSPALRIHSGRKAPASPVK